MDWMNLALEILKLTIPALAVFLVTYYVLKQYLENDYQKRALELRSKNGSTVIPVKMQAYERMVLYLERIHPSNILVRLTNPTQTAQQLKNDLLYAINEEYDHNVAQQLYISPQSWKLIRVVKEQMLQMINQCYLELDAGASGVDLSKAILDRIIKDEEVPTEKAIEFLKKEFKLVFD